MAKHIHLMGVGGIGMSAIAHLLIKRGWRVSGCDLKENELLEELRRQGVSVSIGHSIKHLENVDMLAYSSAIPDDNPEIREAKSRGIKLARRAQMLSHLMKKNQVITVTGMHGKTTAASLVSFLLSEAGLSPTVAVGGILQNLGVNALLGEGKYFVAEADESDGSFLYFHPDYSIITNIDHEHLDYYKDFDFLLATFGRFINQTRKNGCLLYWEDDPCLNKLVSNCQSTVISFGLNQSADVYAAKLNLNAFCSEFDCFYRGNFIGRIRLGLGGRHNILNCLPVIALGLELGIDTKLIKAALSQYKGTRRRMQIKFKSCDYLLLDDYGHHPTEIKATLQTLQLLDAKRLLVVFQPHRYSRTKFLLDSFANCFDLAQRLVITDVYPAGESPEQGIGSLPLYERLKQRAVSEVSFLPKNAVLDYVLKILNPGDVILVLGAGDITQISDELADALRRQTQNKRALSKAYQF